MEYHKGDNNKILQELIGRVSNMSLCIGVINILDSL